MSSTHHETSGVLARLERTAWPAGTVGVWAGNRELAQASEVNLHGVLRRLFAALPGGRTAADHKRGYGLVRLAPRRQAVELSARIEVSA